MADTGRFILLVKSVGTSGGAPSAGAAETSVVEHFEQAVSNAAGKTGVKVNDAFAAQGSYDFIVDFTVDTGNFPAIDGVPAAKVTAQHVAVGFAGALAITAGVTTETVPIVPLNDDTFAKVFHSCTTAADG